MDLGLFPTTLEALTALPGPVGQTLEALKSATVHLEFDHSFNTAASAGKSVEVKLETVRRQLQGVGENLPAFIPKESTYWAWLC